MNTIDELVEVFEDWDTQLRIANITHLFDEVDDPEAEDATSQTAAAHDCEPGGLS